MIKTIRCIILFASIFASLFVVNAQNRLPLYTQGNVSLYPKGEMEFKTKYATIYQTYGPNAAVPNAEYTSMHIAFSKPIDCDNVILYFNSNNPFQIPQGTTEIEHDMTSDIYLVYLVNENNSSISIKNITLSDNNDKSYSPYLLLGEILIPGSSTATYNPETGRVEYNHTASWYASSDVSYIQQPYEGKIEFKQGGAIGGKEWKVDVEKGESVTYTLQLDSLCTSTSLYWKAIKEDGSISVKQLANNFEDSFTVNGSVKECCIELNEASKSSPSLYIKGITYKVSNSPQTHKAEYDLNADGSVNIGDVTTLINFILGKE